MVDNLNPENILKNMFNRFKNNTKKLPNYEKEEQKRKQILEDQGQWKTLWEEANKTAQDKDQQIANLSQQLEDMKTSKEVESTKTTALSSSNAPKKP